MSWTIYAISTLKHSRGRGHGALLVALIIKHLSGATGCGYLVDSAKMLKRWGMSTGLTSKAPPLLTPLQPTTAGTAEFPPVKGQLARVQRQARHLLEARAMRQIRAARRLIQLHSN